MGHERLKKELENLERRERHDVIRAIEVAREHGDLKENAEYHAAKEQQGFIEARIRDIEGKLSHANVIDVSKVDARGRVVFGSTVDLLDEDDGSRITYQIVGEDEASIRDGLISFTSPIARALIGKEEGDQVTVAAPGGARTYEILEVRYI